MLIVLLVVEDPPTFVLHKLDNACSGVCHMQLHPLRDDLLWRQNHPVRRRTLQLAIAELYAVGFVDVPNEQEPEIARGKCKPILEDLALSYFLSFPQRRLDVELLVGATVRIEHPVHTARKQH